MSSNDKSPPLRVTPYRMPDRFRQLPGPEVQGAAREVIETFHGKPGEVPSPDQSARVNEDNLFPSVPYPVK